MTVHFCFLDYKIMVKFVLGTNHGTIIKKKNSTNRDGAISVNPYFR